MLDSWLHCHVIATTVRQGYFTLDENECYFLTLFPLLLWFVAIPLARLSTSLPVYMYACLHACLQTEIRQHACIGMGKAYSRHVSAKWMPKDEYVHGVGGKPQKGRGKAKANAQPVRLGPLFM